VLLRFARVYPLHLAALLLLLAFQTASALAGPGVEMGSLAEFLANLSMLQGFGVIEPGSWNAPAWFISVEFGVSILFALLCLVDIPRSAAGLGALTLCVFWALWLMGGRPEGLSADGAGMLLRGFAGFMLGVLTQAARASAWASRWRRDQGVVISTIWEIAVLAAAIAFIAGAPPVSHAIGPLVFAALVFIFSSTGGAIRRLLERGPAQALARISFGVFMCHWLVAGAVRDIAASPQGGLFSTGALGPAEAAALATPLYLLIVIALAIVAERWVERPTRNAMRAWIDRRNRSYAAGARRRSNVV
jgi:peptidoglycan/LPS O-acetylase OafA/YrhL